MLPGTPKVNISPAVQVGLASPPEKRSCWCPGCGKHCDGGGRRCWPSGREEELLQHLDPLVSAQRGNPSPVPPYSPPEHSSCEVPTAHHQHNPAGVCAEALQ